MKIKITRNYYDKTLKRIVEAGQFIEVSEERAKALSDSTFGIIVNKKETVNLQNDGEPGASENSKAPESTPEKKGSSGKSPKKQKI